MNKKVRNATKVVKGDIIYRSKFDAWAHERFQREGFEAAYETRTFVLMGSFSTLDRTVEAYIPKKIRGENQVSLQKLTKFTSVTYTPDITFPSPKLGYKLVYIIECKGFPNDVYPYKRKMFLNMLNEQNEGEVKHIFFEVHNHKDIENAITIIKQHESTL